MAWTTAFDETGGYDSMTGCWTIYDGARIVAEVDQRCYGQAPCDYGYRSQEAGSIAQLPELQAGIRALGAQLNLDLD